jgi:hypothetical protein
MVGTRPTLSPDRTHFALCFCIAFGEWITFIAPIMLSLQSCRQPERLRFFLSTRAKCDSVFPSTAAVAQW